MRAFLQAVWNAPKEEFEWFLGVFWDYFLYIAVMVLLLRWLWRLASAPSSKK
jgi:hypothetical protein